MSATYCLGPFSERLRKLKTLDALEWKAEVERVPEKCERGCGVDCRAFCAAYARTQLKMARMRADAAKRKAA